MWSHQPGQAAFRTNLLHVVESLLHNEESPFMEQQGSQQPTTRLYPEPADSSQTLTTHSSNNEPADSSQTLTTHSSNNEPADSSQTLTTHSSNNEPADSSQTLTTHSSNNKPADSTQTHTTHSSNKPADSSQTLTTHSSNNRFVTTLSPSPACHKNSLNRVFPTKNS
jgi:hypothetical protein